MRNEIAIIGMGCRLPGAENASQFWENLRAGRETISRFGHEELREGGVNEELLSSAGYVPAKGVVADADSFDAEFFGMTPREAECTDPQHRVLLECAWNTLESAGHDAESFSGRIGIYAGCGIPGYVLTNVLPGLAREGRMLNGLSILIASDKDHLTSRTAYKLNLRGPAVTVQTACSTSLVAVHMACQAILAGECQMALAGGANITSPLKNGYVYEPGGIVSPDGHCRPFDAAAQGTVFGDGVGLVLLRKFDEAALAGDHIHAIILGSSINNDGHGKIGYSAPSTRGEREAIVDALMRAKQLNGVYDVDYVEAHGTATPLGDPIEVAALREVAEGFASERGRIALGSVKSNVGHLDAAAGVAGLIKTVLSIENGEIPATLHYRARNPEIDFGVSGIYVNDTLRSWPVYDRPRRAAVSSFGVGGTNAHLILEQAPAIDRTQPSIQGSFLLVLSAKTSGALRRRRQLLAEHLEDHPEISPADLAFTLQSGRRAFFYREYLVAKNLSEAITRLRGDNLDGQHRQTSAAPPPVAFLFPGLGACCADRGRDLYEHELVFRQSLEESARVLLAERGWDLLRLLYPRQEDREDAEKTLAQIEFALPTVFCLEFALATLWMHRGVYPTEMLGHGPGEWVAATVSEVFTFEDGIRTMALLGHLLQNGPQTMLISARIDEAQANWFLEPDISLSSIDGPNRCVFSGAAGPIGLLQSRLSEAGIQSHLRTTGHPIHTPLGDSVIEPLRRWMRTIRRQRPQRSFLSCVTGVPVTAEQATSPDYWIEQLQASVRYWDGVQRLSHGNFLCLEVGPGNRPSDPVEDGVGTPRHPFHAGLGEGNEDEQTQIAKTTGELWLQGIAIDWNAIRADGTHRVPLPTYPFERRRHWIDMVESKPSACGQAPEESPDSRVSSLGRGLPPEERTEKAIRSRLRRIAQELTGIEVHAISEDASLSELGVDSLLTISLMQLVRNEFGVELSAEFLLNGNTTLRMLTDHLRESILEVTS